MIAALASYYAYAPQYALARYTSIYMLWGQHSTLMDNASLLSWCKIVALASLLPKAAVMLHADKWKLQAFKAHRGHLVARG